MRAGLFLTVIGAFVGAFVGAFADLDDPPLGDDAGTFAGSSITCSIFDCRDIFKSAGSSDKTRRRFPDG